LGHWEQKRHHNIKRIKLSRPFEEQTGSHKSEKLKMGKNKQYKKLQFFRIRRVPIFKRILLSPSTGKGNCKTSKQETTKLPEPQENVI
jgi:hypothetical protein